MCWRLPFAAVVVAAAVLAVSAAPRAEPAAARGREAAAQPPLGGPFAVVLGIAQDGGYPQAGTKQSDVWDDAAQRRSVACLGLVDPESAQRWLVDATPDLPRQLHRLDVLAPVAATPGLAGVLLTHAHIGHYTGLMYFGREAMGAHGVPVYAMQRMAGFLRTNGPWELLVRLGNVELRPLLAGVRTPLSPRLAAIPLRVPHRDEYSETVAFRIAGPRRSLLWLPDIDKWERWDAEGTRLESVLASVDVAYLDGTFFGEGEVPGRSMSEIPHPFVRESMLRLASLPARERAKVRFVHLNRSNPLLHDGAARRQVEAAGMGVAEEGERVDL